MLCRPRTTSIHEMTKLFDSNKFDYMYFFNTKDTLKWNMYIYSFCIQKEFCDDETII